MNLSRICSSSKWAEKRWYSVGPGQFDAGADALGGTIKSVARPSAPRWSSSTFPSGRGGVHLAEGQGGAAGVGAARRGVRPGPSTASTVLLSTQTLNNWSGSIDEFMEVVEADADRDLTVVMTGEVYPHAPGPASRPRTAAGAAWEVRPSWPGVRHHDQLVADGRRHGPDQRAPRTRAARHALSTNSGPVTLASLNLVKSSART